MSTLNVSNITDGTDTVATGYVLNGSAKAWAKYSSISTPSFWDSFNCSSLTDHGVGDIDVNLTNSFSSSDWAGTISIGGGSYGDQSFLQQTSTSSAIHIYQYQGSHSTYDSGYCWTIAVGDLA
jgi:hypothetical protein